MRIKYQLYGAMFLSAATSAEASKPPGSSKTLMSGACPTVKNFYAPKTELIAWIKG